MTGFSSWAVLLAEWGVNEGANDGLRGGLAVQMKWALH